MNEWLTGFGYFKNHDPIHSLLIVIHVLSTNQPSTHHPQYDHSINQPNDDDNSVGV